MLANWGGAAPATQAGLASLGTDIEIIDAAGQFGPAGEADTVTNDADRFRVRAAAGAAIEVPQYCRLVLAGPGYDDTVRVPLVVGDSMNLPAGPDSYGYRIYDYTDSCYASRPDYDWVELRGLGTELGLGGDETRSLALPAGFGTWQYYGREFDSISICSNGWVAPGATSRVDFVNVQLPYEGSPPNIVAVCWDDLDLADYGAVWYWHDTTGHRFIVEFDSVPYFGHPADWETAQFQLADRTVGTPTGDNSMTVHFKTANYFHLSTVGLQDATGTVGLTHCCNDWYPAVSAPLRPGRAVRFETAAQSGVAAPVKPGVAGGLAIFPNPFRRSAVLSCSSERPRATALAVFDPAGRRVGRLPVRLVAGANRVAWRPALEPGVYFVRLEGSEPAQSVRVVVLP